MSLEAKEFQGLRPNRKRRLTEFQNYPKGLSKELEKVEISESDLYGIKKHLLDTKEEHSIVNS